MIVHCWFVFGTKALHNGLPLQEASQEVKWRRLTVV